MKKRYDVIGVEDLIMDLAFQIDPQRMGLAVFWIIAGRVAGMPPLPLWHWHGWGLPAG